MRVLIVEDDADILSLLRRGFAAEGYDVTAVSNGEKAMEEVRLHEFGTIILDLMLPGMSGIHVCEKLRLMGIEATILILSARDRLADRLEGLNAGADDYVIKPFSLEEVLARVKAQSRRHSKEEDINPEKRIVSGGFNLDLTIHELHFNGESISLSERESDLLVMFFRRVNEPLSRDDIFEALWADQGGNTINVVDVYIGYLRKKISGLGVDSKQVIKTIRGTGFMYKMP